MKKYKKLHGLNHREHRTWCGVNIDKFPTGHAWVFDIFEVTCPECRKRWNECRDMLSKVEFTLGNTEL